MKREAYVEGTKHDIARYYNGSEFAAWVKGSRWVFIDDPSGFDEIHADIAQALGYGDENVKPFDAMVDDGWVRVRVDRTGSTHHSGIYITGTYPADSSVIANIVGVLYDAGVLSFEDSYEYWQGDDTGSGSKGRKVVDTLSKAAKVAGTGVYEVRGYFPPAFEKEIRATIAAVERNLPKRVEEIVKGVTVEVNSVVGQKDFYAFCYGQDYMNIAIPDRKTFDAKKFAWTLAHETWHIYVYRTRFYWETDPGKEVVEWANWLYNTEFGRERMNEVLQAIEKRWGFSGEAALKMLLDEQMAESFAKLVTTCDKSPFVKKWVDISQSWMENYIYERVGKTASDVRIEENHPSVYLYVDGVKVAWMEFITDPNYQFGRFPTPTLTKLYVDEKRKGYGRILVNWAKEKAKRLGFDTIVVFGVERTEEARDFWTAMGAHPTPQTIEIMPIWIMPTKTSKVASSITYWYDPVDNKWYNCGSMNHAEFAFHNWAMGDASAFDDYDSAFDEAMKEGYVRVGAAGDTLYITAENLTQGLIKAVANKAYDNGWVTMQGIVSVYNNKTDNTMNQRMVDVLMGRVLVAQKTMTLNQALQAAIDDGWHTATDAYMYRGKRLTSLMEDYSYIGPERQFVYTGDEIYELIDGQRNDAMGILIVMSTKKRPKLKHGDMITFSHSKLGDGVTAEVVGWGDSSVTVEYDSLYTHVLWDKITHINGKPLE